MNCVVVCADDAFAAQLAVTLHTVHRHLESGQGLDVLVMTPDMSTAHREEIAELVPGLRLTWRTVSLDEFRDVPLNGPVVTYLRMLLGEHVGPEYRRVLYLDCDVLVRRDVSVLFDTDLDGNIVGACQDMLALRIGSPTGLPTWKELGLDPRAPFLNAGVLLIDMERWRAERLGERLTEYMRAWGHTNRYWDQDAVNACVSGRWRRLPLEWNYTPAIDIEDTWAAVVMDPHELAAAHRDPAIVHFAGTKPWSDQGVDGVWTPSWFEALRATGFEVAMQRSPWWMRALRAAWLRSRPLASRLARKYG